MKYAWPVGKRDQVILQHVVKYQGKCWASHYSVDDDSTPLQGSHRSEVTCHMLFLKPNPEINGYTAIVDTNFAYGGQVPMGIVGSKACPTFVKHWIKLQKAVFDSTEERLKNR